MVTDELFEKKQTCSLWKYMIKYKTNPYYFVYDGSYPVVQYCLYENV